jgi:chaperone required for assembly of F1-ATPase
MLSRTIKRFYKQAGVERGEGGFSVRLDGKPVKTPAAKALAVPGLRLAEAIAAEWDAQGDEVVPSTMPMTQLASTALDRVGPERAAIVEQLLNYAGTDLLCYRADFPPELASRQAAGWDPILDWAAEAFGARLVVTAGIIAVDQPPAALEALKRAVEDIELWRLTALQATAAASGSLILGLALVHGRLSAADTFALSQLDETFQIEQWGEDWEAAERRSRLQADILSAERLLSLLV